MFTLIDVYCLTGGEECVLISVLRRRYTSAFYISVIEKNTAQFRYKFLFCTNQSTFYSDFKLD